MVDRMEDDEKERYLKDWSDKDPEAMAECQAFSDQIVENSDSILENDDTRKMNGAEIVFGSSTKKPEKLRKQMEKRGWTEQSVRETVDAPVAVRKSMNKSTGNEATVYYNGNGAYVIIDDKTKEVFQVSDNIHPDEWTPDQEIINPFIME